VGLKIILARLDPLAVVGGMGLAADIAPGSSRGIASGCIASDFPSELSDVCAAARCIGSERSGAGSDAMAGVLLAFRAGSFRAAGAASSFDGDRP
jgi:hypothetical protein